MISKGSSDCHERRETRVRNEGLQGFILVKKRSGTEQRMKVHIHH